MAHDASTNQDAGPRPAGSARVGRLLGAVGIVVVLLIGIGVVRGWPGWLPGWLPSLGNPFQEQTTERSGPVLLESIQDLSRFTAASGNFEVIVDVERGRRFIPDAILSERVLLVAAGSVDAYVEFGGLAAGALVVDEANDAVEVTLPAPELTQPNIDHERSYVYAVQRGAANRIGDFFGSDQDSQLEILGLAEERIAAAATESELPERAETNTRLMLEGMLGLLGFELVAVTFVSP